MTSAPGTRGARRGRFAFAAFAALNEPTRHQVYDVVRARGEPMTRDDVAAALSIGRPIAAFHLDTLAKAGLLRVDFARPPGRRGPGAGRPAKRYQVADDDISLSLPERRYDLASQILAAGVRDAADLGDARAATFAAATEKGREIGRAYATVAPRRRQRGRARAVLADLGYEAADERNAVRLRNCPFHAVVDVAPELVCQVNLRMIEGLLDELGLDRLEACLEPTPGECCVRIRDTA